MCKILLRYPSAEEELAILEAYDQGHDLHRAAQSELTPVTNPEEVLATRRDLVGIKTTSRGHAIPERSGPGDAVVSADPGGCQPEGRRPPALVSKSLAAMDGREFVTPDDVKAAAPAVLRHRLILTPEAQVAAETPDRVLMRALAQVEVPR